MCKRLLTLVAYRGKSQVKPTVEAAANSQTSAAEVEVTELEWDETPELGLVKVDSFKEEERLR